jgi:dihydroxyacid dehydratase/phosphogluconate dehydratase
MKTIERYLFGDVMTVTGEPVRTYYEKAVVKNDQVIHSLESPWRKESSLALLRGNMAAGGSILKVSGVLPSMMKFRGKAKVFASEPNAIRYIREREIKDPTVFVLIQQGLKGAPGIQTLLPLAGEIVGRGLEDRVAIISDGRFSGAARGLCIGLVTPESAEGGEIGLVKDGDFISIDVPNRNLHLEIDDAELDQRREVCVPFAPEINSPFLASFIESARPLHQGAVEGMLDRGKYKVLSEKI